jgi:hypothetical protein
MNIKYWYTESRKDAGSSPDEGIEFFQFTWSFKLHHVPGVCSGTNRNEYQKIFSWE